ncbi:MAG: glycoside-pentoside-hexuronide (GPH):cation symporter [Bacteroidetes bacterium]|nr:glycoside-pentoside-hexuronide (GPH):cation symporter [Bacteroidota bacterium]MCL6103700.1 glycoside-pentoside-hexuronide (GPH):cation symporter [Bacteroidota bacterium]
MQQENTNNAVSTARISFKEKFSYGLGDVGNNMLFDMGQIYLLKFYTDSLGLPAAVAGLVFLLTKIWDGFADVTVGTWIDSRKKIGKRGKFRPFMLYAALPLALITIVSFTTPGFSLTGKTIWAFATYMAFGTIYSIFNIPYGSMIPAMTQDSVERSELASFRWAGANTGLLIATVAFMPIVTAFDSMQTGYVVAATVFAFFGLIFQLFSYHGIKERHVYKKPQGMANAKVSLLSNYKSLFRNMPLLILSLVNLFTFSAFNVKLAVQVYYCQYSLNDISLVPYMGFFSIGCVFIGISMVPFIVRHIGKKSTYILGSAIWAFADIMAWFFAKSPVPFILFACLAFFGTSFINTLNWALVSDAVEYGEWKTGNRSEGLVYSFFIFFRKMSQAFAGFVPGIVLAAVGYVPNAVQSLEALNGIKGLMFIYPAALAVTTIITMGFFYKLSDSRFSEIVVELNERKLAESRT